MDGVGRVYLLPAHPVLSQSPSVESGVDMTEIVALRLAVL